MFAAVIVIVLVVASLAAIEVVCLALALYELLNGEARTLRLDGATLIPALVNVAVETVSLAACLVALPIGFVRIPGRTRVASERQPRGARRPVVVFVPTWPLNRFSFAVMRRRLSRDGWTDAVGVGLPIVGGDLLTAARALGDAIDAVTHGDRDQPVTLIAHGTGGLVCRAYLRWCGGTSRVAKLVTLATPHGGSKLYALATSRFLWELRPDSDALRALADDDPVPSVVDTTAVYSSFDLCIVPSRLAYYPGAGNIEVEGVGHFSMLWSRRIHQLVRENLEYVTPRMAAPAAGSDRQPAA